MSETKIGKIREFVENVEYNGKSYPLKEICIKHREIYPTGMWVKIAPESLADALKDFEGEYTDPKAIEMDEMIYHYVEDDVFAKGDWKDIAKNHLDELFELIDEPEDD